MPGNKAKLGANDIIVWLSANILPHEGVGGCTPKPTYDRPASARIPKLNCMLPCTISKFNMLGKICSKEILKDPFPAILAEEIKSNVQIDIAAPLVTLAKTGILKTPIAKIALKAEGPNTAVIKIAITNDGKAKIRSFPLIIISSNNEPRHEAEIKPKGTPKNNPRPTAIKATDKEVCPPIIIIEKISLPK